MKKAGKLWTNDGDRWFQTILEQTGDLFDQEHLDYALSLVTDWSCALDVGAHYGTWCRQMAKRFDRVIAFEGRHDTYECLLHNIEQFPNIEAHNKAIGDKIGSVEIGKRPEHKNETNAGLSCVLGDGSTPMITIDSLNLPSLGFLKLDIEGFEIFALRGAQETIHRFKPIIILEDNKRNLDYGFQRGDTCAFVESLGATKVKQFKGNHIYKW